MNKYRNHIVKKPYGKFDSQKEHDYYLYLLSLLKRKEISDLHRQVKYELIPAQYETHTIQLKTKQKEKRVEIERACSYIADYVFKDKEGNTVVVDTKGVRTPDYIIKRKLMLFINHIKIKEI